MKELAAIKYLETRSRFFAHLYRIECMDDIDRILKVHRSKYKKANHHCFAAVIDDEDHFKNDGEVGHPGQVLLGILKREDLNSHCLMVSRIFGGTKLGVGGVSRAFREAGNCVVDNYRS